MTNTPVSEIVAALGGPAPIAAELGCGTSNVREWKATGIPAKHHHKLVLMAKRLGKTDISHEVLASAVPDNANRRRPAAGDNNANSIGATPNPLANEKHITSAGGV